MTDVIPQLRQWLEARRERAAERMRTLPTGGVAEAILSAKVTAEYFAAMDTLDKLRELEVQREMES